MVHATSRFRLGLYHIHDRFFIIIVSLLYVSTFFEQSKDPFVLVARNLERLLK